MTVPTFDRPAASEYAEYYGKYVGRVPDGNLLQLLAAQIDEFAGLIRTISEEKAGFAYAPGKWTIKEMVGHIADTERVMSYRALAFSRNERQPLPGFDENAWVPPAGFNQRTLASLLDEWIAVRRASLALLGGMPSDAPARSGNASGKDITVRALAYILHGHVVHHTGVLEERYLRAA